MAQIQLSLPSLSPSLSSSEAGFLLYVAFFALLFSIFWTSQFVTLMTLEEKRFPGPHVRIGWVVVFLILWFLAPFAFLFWEKRMGPRKPRRRVPPGYGRTGSDSGH